MCLQYFKFIIWIIYFKNSPKKTIHLFLLNLFIMLCRPYWSQPFEKKVFQWNNSPFAPQDALTLCPQTTLCVECFSVYSSAPFLTCMIFSFPHACLPIDPIPPDIQHGSPSVIRSPRTNWLNQLKWPAALWIIHVPALWLLSSGLFTGLRKKSEVLPALRIHVFPTAVSCIWGWR